MEMYGKHDNPIFLLHILFFRSIYPLVNHHISGDVMPWTGHYSKLQVNMFNVSFFYQFRAELTSQFEVTIEQERNEKCTVLQSFTPIQDINQGSGLGVEIKNREHASGSHFGIKDWHPGSGSRIMSKDQIQGFGLSLTTKDQHRRIQIQDWDH